MPRSREVTADEYVAISRKIAGIIGIDPGSYTQLDVYKRQVRSSNEARNIGEAYLEKAINHLKALRLLTPCTEYNESPTRKIIIGRNKL